METIDKPTLSRNLLFRWRKEEISRNRLRLGVGVLSLECTFVYLLKKNFDYSLSSSFSFIFLSYKLYFLESIKSMLVYISMGSFLFWIEGSTLFQSKGAISFGLRGQSGLDFPIVRLRVNDIFGFLRKSNRFQFYDSTIKSLYSLTKSNKASMISILRQYD